MAMTSLSSQDGEDVEERQPPPQKQQRQQRKKLQQLGLHLLQLQQRLKQLKCHGYQTDYLERYWKGIGNYGREIGDLGLFQQDQPPTGEYHLEECHLEEYHQGHHQEEYHQDGVEGQDGLDVFLLSRSLKLN